MQRFIMTVCSILVLALGAQAQGRRQIANFSQYQQYYNPALTGFEGGTLKSLYRNQWTGFEDAPKTLLASAEIDLKEIGDRRKGYRLGNQQQNTNYLEGISAKHALGLTLLHDRFGPSKETQVALSYGSGVRLSERLSLRWGTAVTFAGYFLDGNSLTLDQENDPKYTSLLGRNNRTGKVDLNLGVALSAAKFYMGYAMQDVTAGKLVYSGDGFMEERYTQKHIAQAGYRTMLTERFGVTVNSIFQYDRFEAGTLEGQLKAVYQHMIWVGGGYRSDQAISFSGGVRLNQLLIHYAYETPVQDARYVSKSTNEIGLCYTLKKLNNTNNARQPAIW